MEENYNYFPIKHLNEFVSEILNSLLQQYGHLISFTQEENNKLFFRINEIEENGWRLQNLCNFDNNRVSLSMSFAEMVWLLCYTALLKADNEIYKREFEKEVVTTDEVIRDIEANINSDKLDSSQKNN